MDKQIKRLRSTLAVAHGKGRKTPIGVGLIAVFYGGLFLTSVILLLVGKRPSPTPMPLSPSNG